MLLIKEYHSPSALDLWLLWKLLDYCQILLSAGDDETDPNIDFSSQKVMNNRYSSVTSSISSLDEDNTDVNTEETKLSSQFRNNGKYREYYLCYPILVRLVVLLLASGNIGVVFRSRVWLVVLVVVSIE